MPGTPLSLPEREEIAAPATSTDVGVGEVCEDGFMDLPWAKTAGSL
jgi:hypothetical protein